MMLQVQVTISDDEFRLGWDELQQFWISCISKRFVRELTVFCGGLGGSSPGLFLPKQATRHASLNSLLKTVKTTITHRPCDKEQQREGERRSNAGSILKTVAWQLVDWDWDSRTGDQRKTLGFTPLQRFENTILFLPAPDRGRWICSRKPGRCCWRPSDHRARWRWPPAAAGRRLEWCYWRERERDVPLNTR